jgi:hypothetical protein
MKLNGVAFGIEINTGTVAAPVYKKLASETSCSINVAYAEIDVTDKTSGDFGDFLSGLGNGDCSFEAFYNTTTGANEFGYDELFAMAGPNKPDVLVRIRVEQGVTDKTISFPAVITKLDITAQVNEGVKVSGGFKLKAKPVIGTATA